MFCRNCGKKIPNNAAFCNYCGTLQNNTIAQGSWSQQPYTAHVHNTQKTAPVSKMGALEKFKTVVAVLVMIAASAIMANWRVIFGKQQPAADAQNNIVSSKPYYKESKEPQGMNEETFPFYALLSDKKKVVYEEALSCIENAEKEFIPSYELDQTTIDSILKYIYYDQPHLFWYEPNNRQLLCDNETGNVLSITLGYNDLADHLEYNRKLVKEVTDQLVSKTNGLSDLEAERFFHDYLCRNVAYQSGAYDQNIYSAFIENKTVCAGYTRALQYLMMQRGVPCYYCTGVLYDEDEQDWGSHAWNLVKLNENFYNCDVTWDDFYNETDKYPSYISYEHFNTSDAKYVLDAENDMGRLRTGDGILLPACDADDMNYEALYGTE